MQELIQYRQGGRAADAQRAGGERRLDFSIGRKIFYSYLLVVAVVVGFSSFVIARMGALNGEVKDYAAKQRALSAVQRYQLHIANVWQFFTDASLTRDGAVISAEAEPNYQAAGQALDEAIALTAGEKSGSAS